MSQRVDSQLSANELKRAQSGDHKAFKKIYDLYFPFVRFIVYRYGEGGPKGDDVIQESFIRLHQNLGSIGDVEKIKSWLATTVRNLIIDGKRREKRVAVAPNADISLQLETMSVADEGEAALQRELEVKVLGDLLDSIATEPGGESFVLFYRDGLTAAQIAARNKEAISTVTTRISRMRQRFGERLRDHIQQLRG